MKILEAQNALISNFEVFQFLSEQKPPKGREHGRPKGRPSNFETLTKEVLEYLKTSPNPLSQTPTPYNAEAVYELVKRLTPFDLAKGEVLMLLNLRPASAATLNPCVEELEERFDEDKQQQMLDIIAEVLGKFPPREDAQDDTAGNPGNDPDARESVENGAS